MKAIFEPNEGQRNAVKLLSGPATHIFLRGGSRSGKTVILLRSIIIRALKAPESRHGIFRQTLTAARATLLGESFPGVMKLCFPDLPYKLYKSEDTVHFPNGSTILFGGLDSHERTEKVLGHEFSTLYINEASQVSCESRNMLLTRLAQKTSLVLKEYIDANPPSASHWLYKIFEQKIDPVSGLALSRPLSFATMVLNPIENRVHLPPAYFDQLCGLPERERRRFLDGDYAVEEADMLWTRDRFIRKRDISRKDNLEIRKGMGRVIVAVDPSGVSAARDLKSDEVGIVVCGVDHDKNFHVLEDLSLRESPAGWGRVVVNAVERWDAEMIVAEKNFGGALVEANIRAAGATVPVKLVSASRGKVARAEPVAALYERGRVIHHGDLTKVEGQMINFSVSGYSGAGSPDRADALVWGLTELMSANPGGVINGWSPRPLSFER